jgi:GDP-4-dehydro-6-deoxy-D-mannose reductase
MTVSTERGVLAVTGVDGFVGRHVARLASRRGWRVVGLARATELDGDLRSFLADYIPVDLRNEWPLAGKVDAIIHLAGLAAVGPSFGRPQQYIEWNSAMVTTICESILSNSQGRARPVRVVGVSSGAVYDSAAATDPLDEASPVAASSPYVISKLLVEQQLAYYAKRGLDTLVVRPFNHIGPGQNAQGFLIPDLAANLRALAPGDTLAVGDLSTERDYTDVRDVADAYLRLAEAPHHEHLVYNVASGTSRAGLEMLGLLANAMGIPMPSMKTDPTRFRATDARRIVGSATRLRSEFGWSPTVPIERSIIDFVADSTAHDVR